MRPSFILRRPFVVVTSLGNPEPHYAMTRHSVGHEMLNLINGSKWETRPNISKNAKIMIHPELKNVMLLKPGCYMNVSGTVVSPVWQRIKENLCKQGHNVRLICIHDELSKEAGQFQLRYGEVSSRGHNGLRSVVGHFGNDFFRFGVGIGRPDDKKNVADYVLSKMPRNEWEKIVWDVSPKLNDVIEMLAKADTVELKNGKLVGK